MAWSIYLAFAIGLHSAAAQQCWWPDQETSSPWVPCDPSSSASACCPEDGFCLGDGLCYTNGVLTRGGCTDRTWGDGCPAACRGTNPTGAAVLSWCNFDTNLFTCGSCNNQSQLFTLTGADRIVLRPYQAAPIQNPSSSSVLTIAPSGQLPTAFNVAKTTASATSTGGATATVTETVTTAGATVAAQGKSSSGTFTAGDVAGAALGTGIPLLIALGAALFVIWRQRKRLPSNSAASAAPMEQKMQPHNSNVPVYSPMSTNSQTTMAVGSGYGHGQSMHAGMPVMSSDTLPAQKLSPYTHAPVPINEIRGQERLELDASG